MSHNTVEKLQLLIIDKNGPCINHSKFHWWINFTDLLTAGFWESKQLNSE